MSRKIVNCNLSSNKMSESRKTSVIKFIASHVVRLLCPRSQQNLIKYPKNEFLRTETGEKVIKTVYRGNKSNFLTIPCSCNRPEGRL